MSSPRDEISYPFAKKSRAKNKRIRAAVKDLLCRQPLFKVYCGSRLKEGGKGTKENPLLFTVVRECVLIKLSPCHEEAPPIFRGGEPFSASGKSSAPFAAAYVVGG